MYQIPDEISHNSRHHKGSKRLANPDEVEEDAGVG